MQWTRSVLMTSGLHRRSQGAMPFPKFLACTVILCFERWYPKQNSVIRLKSNILPPNLSPKNFGLATPLPGYDDIRVPDHCVDLLCSVSCELLSNSNLPSVLIRDWRFVQWCYRRSRESLRTVFSNFERRPWSHLLTCETPRHFASRRGGGDEKVGGVMTGDGNKVAVYWQLWLCTAPCEVKQF